MRIKLRASFYIRQATILHLELFKWLIVGKVFCSEFVSMGSAGARTRRSLGHHLLHLQILRLLVLCAPADFEAQSSLL